MLFDACIDALTHKQIAPIVAVSTRVDALSVCRVADPPGSTGGIFFVSAFDHVARCPMRKGRCVMAIQTLKRWGNSLAVRIPSNVASEVAFSEGQEVDVQVEDGQVLIRPHQGIKRFSRERYLQQLRDARLEPHELVDFGEPQGSEPGGPDDPTRLDQRISNG
ncbi:AbrB/MazE/SpoVT family DNA-binding domain-containing protein [Burkholderia glumae]